MVKEVADYVDKVQERFPFLTKSEINKILTFGLKRYAWANKMHADVLITKRNNEIFTAHCGPLGVDALKHFYRFLTKNRMRERVLFKMRKLEWDGYYYIGLSDEDHAKVAKNSRYKTFTNIYMTKLKKELYHIPQVKHIWKVPWFDCGWRFFLETLKTQHAEYIGENEYEKYHQCFRGGTTNRQSPNDGE